MRIAIDFDGTIVDDSHAYDDTSTPLVFNHGAREALYSLKRAGHWLMLWSGRSTVGSQMLSSTLNKARLKQMLEFVARELPTVFDAVDDGHSGKPSVDLFIDDKAIRFGADMGGVGWKRIAGAFGQAPESQPGRVGPSWKEMSLEWSREVRQHGVSEVKSFGSITDIGKTKAGRVIRIMTSGSRDCIIIAGQHGEEPAGVIALYKHAQEIFDFAAKLDVRLIVYPCVNPEGYDRGQRHNMANEQPTNSFLEYRLAGAKHWVGEVPPGKVAQGVRDFSNPTSKETRYLSEDLHRLGLTKGFTVLDMHEDSMVPAGGAFAYVFGEREKYAAVMQRSGAIPLANTKLKNDSWTDLHTDLWTDEHGLVEFMDGTVTDYLWRRSAGMSACLECSTKDLPSAVGIAREWILGLIEAAAGF